MSTAFGLEPVAHTSIRENVEEHLVRLANELTDNLNEKAMAIFLQRVVGSFVGATHGAASRSDGDLAAESLECGADDYVQKPFRTKELLARLANALRRRWLEQGKVARVVSGDLEIDLLHRRVCLHGQPVRLPHKSYEVLRVLAEKPGQVLSHGEILSAVWGANYASRTAYLRVAIRELRLKLEADPAHPRHILTETHVGYRLEFPARPRPPSLVVANAGDRLR